MSHCFVHGCRTQVMGGFVEHINVPDHDDSYETLPGMRTGWCKEHEPQGREHIALFAKPGRFLNRNELACL